MKFTANRVLREGPASAYYDPTSAGEDPAARRILGLGGVTGVMLLNDFCTVNQDGSRDWNELAPQVVEILTSVYGQGG
jgi:hypothetical protein